MQSAGVCYTEAESEQDEESRVREETRKHTQFFYGL